MFIGGGFIVYGLSQLHKTPSAESPMLETPSSESVETVIAPIEVKETEIVSTPEAAPENIETKNDIVEVVSAKVKEVFGNNIYVLIKYKSIETDEGIKGYAVGTPLVKENNAYKTPDGNLLLLEESEVTNELETAKKYMDIDKMTQAVLKKAPPITPTPQIIAPVTTPAPVIPNRPATALDKGAYGRRGNDGIYSDNQGRRYKIKDGKVKYLDN